MVCQPIWDVVPVLLSSSIPGGAALHRPTPVLFTNLREDEPVLKKVGAIKELVRQHIARQDVRMDEIEKLLAVLVSQVEKGK